MGNEDSSKQGARKGKRAADEPSQAKDSDAATGLSIRIRGGTLGLGLEIGGESETLAPSPKPIRLGREVVTCMRIWMRADVTSISAMSTDNAQVPVDD
jgi:hypothetical protein